MELVSESWVGGVMVVSLRTLVNVLFSFFFVGTDLILLGRESVSESWIGKVVVISLKTFVNVLFCRNGSLELEDSQILLEIEPVGKSWVGRMVVVSENVC